MTQEEKARAYDEALALAKRLISNNCTEVEKLCLKCVFPELKESEDERIRKALCEFISDTLGDELDGYDISKNEALTYLEKQKEPLTPEEKMNHPLYLEGFDVGRQVGEVVTKPAEWSEEDEKIYDKALDALYYKDCNEKDDVIYALENLCDLIYRKRKRIPKYARWKPSEEQMAMLLAVINEPNNAGAESCRLALKSLYEQLKKLL